MYEDSRTMSCVFAMQGFICNPCWHKGSSTYTVKNKDGKQILTVACWNLVFAAFTFHAINGYTVMGQRN